MNYNTSEICLTLNEPYQWAYEIIDFFDITTIYQKEKESIKKIEAFFGNCKKIFLKDKM